MMKSRARRTLAIRRPVACIATRKESIATTVTRAPPMIRARRARVSQAPRSLVTRSTSATKQAPAIKRAANAVTPPRITARPARAVLARLVSASATAAERLAQVERVERVTAEKTRAPDRPVKSKAATLQRAAQSETPETPGFTRATPALCSALHSRCSPSRAFGAFGAFGPRLSARLYAVRWRKRASRDDALAAPW